MIMMDELHRLQMYPWRQMMIADVNAQVKHNEQYMRMGDSYYEKPVSEAIEGYKTSKTSDSKQDWGPRGI